MTQKVSREPPPLLFDLTSLQRTANRRYGLSASHTLAPSPPMDARLDLVTKADVFLVFIESYGSIAF